MEKRLKLSINATMPAGNAQRLPLFFNGAETLFAMRLAQ